MFSPSNPSRRAAVSRAGVSATGIDEGNGTLFHATDRFDLDAASYSGSISELLNELSTAAAESTAAEIPTISAR